MINPSKSSCLRVCTNIFFCNILNLLQITYIHLTLAVPGSPSNGEAPSHIQRFDGLPSAQQTL